ncbi:unnamed protein product [Closterium sp. NIES-54]
MPPSPDPIPVLSPTPPRPVPIPVPSPTPPSPDPLPVPSPTPPSSNPLPVPSPTPPSPDPLPVGALFLTPTCGPLSVRVLLFPPIHVPLTLLPTPIQMLPPIPKLPNPVPLPTPSPTPLYCAASGDVVRSSAPSNPTILAPPLSCVPGMSTAMSKPLKRLPDTSTFGASIPPLPTSPPP